jgi:hypothetical protein
MKKHVRPTTLLLASLLAGCAAPLEQTVAVPGRTPVARPDQVKVFKRGETPPEPYEILGTVGSVAMGKGMKYVPPKKALKQMKTEAASMGANTLVGFFADDDRTHSSAWWAAALAATMPSPGAQAVPDRKPIVVALPRPTFEEPTTNASPKSPERTCQRFAEYSLIARGYYPQTLDGPLPLTFSELKTLPEAELMACGGPDTDLILLINHTGTSRRYYLLVNSRGDTYEAVLFSKRSRQVVWEQAGGGGATEGIIDKGITGLFWPGRSTMLRTHAAFTDLFKTLPDVSTSTSK